MLFMERDSNTSPPGLDHPLKAVINRHCGRARTKSRANGEAGSLSSGDYQQALPEQQHGVGSDGEWAGSTFLF